MTALTSSPAARRDPSHPAAPIKGFRPDVEGLRAVAIGLVLLYHAGLGFVPGGFVGVDVFFVISGFLITGLLVKELQRGGTVSLAGFYARRAKRLLPAAAIVLTTTVALTLVFLPRVRWSETGGDIIAAALYFVNWRLADRSVDYLAEDSAASPVQHFWSLAVEEQYYFVWPLLILLAGWWARKRGKTLTHELWLGLGLIGVPSLAYSIYQTAVDPAVSFFITTTRMWELAIGAAVALGITQLARMPRGVAVVLGWAGLAAVATSALVYSSSSAWPGYAALLPALGTAAVIAAGNTAGPAGPVKLLGTRGFVFIGGLSYSLYLWHWPLIVAASSHWDGLTPLRGLAVACLSVVPAWLTLRVVENPIRFSPRLGARPSHALKLGAALTASGVVAGLVLVGVTAATTSGAVANAQGAKAITEPKTFQAEASVDGITPDPLEATEDIPDSYERGCQVDVDSTEPVLCDYGDPQGIKTVVLVGDSKALQWISALDTIGAREGWKVRTLTKSSCSFTDAVITQKGKPYDSCTAWNREALAKLLADPPDIVVTSQASGAALVDPGEPARGTSRAAMAAGLRSRWITLTDAGIGVAVVRDNPTPPASLRPVYECVDEHRDNLSACMFTRAESETTGGSTAQLAAAKDLPGVHVVDLNDYLCPGNTCPPVIGNVLVYRQGAHITRSYVNTLHPQLRLKLLPVVLEATARGGG